MYGFSESINLKDNVNTLSTKEIVYIGNLYNTKDLINELMKNNISISSTEEISDEEILLNIYKLFGYDILQKINGVFSFAIWDKTKQEIFIARDHLGVKPLYYTIKNNTLYLANEIKSLFQNTNIKPELDEISINELFGLGPCHTPGLGVFKDIYELKPGHFAIFNKNKFKTIRYWQLESHPHYDSLGTTCEKIRFLIKDSINNQIKSVKPICTFLSGGLDSSIISYYASNYYQNNNLGTLKTFSVDYIDNDKNFQKNDFQPNTDKFYINIITKKMNSEHSNIILDTPDLINNLENSMLARNLPGMADVDSSLLCFCKNVKDQNIDVSLTGECADELFCGYPWFFREDTSNCETFPWSLALNERQSILKPEISSKINLKNYIDNRYNESLNEVELLDIDAPETIKMRKYSYLTIKWFMQTLLDRGDKMGAYNNFDLRVPFCDYRLAQYAWNIPWELKTLKGREKGLLRYAMKDILPSQIIDRKKSPYPKTWNPTYTNKVKEILLNILSNTDAPINQLINQNYILEIINSNGKNFTRPWFGQLMTYPQLMAYLIQINMWLEEYKPIINI